MDPYRKIAQRYDARVEPFNAGLRAIGMKMFPPREGMSVLDVGCGTGTHLALYQEAGCQVFGLDTSPAMMEVARQKLGDRADLRLGDASQMPYEEGQFDLVIMMLALHEMPASVRAAVLDEIRRTMKKDGRLLLIDFHTGPYRPLKGWTTKLLITFMEIAAGREHFKNYRHFLGCQGLLPLIADHQFSVEKDCIVAGGNLALYVVKPN